MSKRPGDHLTTERKRAKTDDFWEQDGLDDCFNQLATQIEQNEISCTQTNNSILPDYENFRPQPVYSSTQVATKFDNGLCLENKNHVNRKNELESLQERYAAKEGEVSILRLQLNQTRGSMLEEQNKKNRESMDKINVLQKENNSLKSQLEFKVLEITNLKQNNVDIWKHIPSPNVPRYRKRNLESIITQNSSNKLERIDTDNNTVKLLENYSQLDSDYPLAKKIPLSYFKIPPIESYTIDVKCTPLPQNSSQNFHYQLGRKEIAGVSIQNNNHLYFDYIYTNYLNLIKCSSKQLDSEEIVPCINKIYCVSLLMLNEFNDSLKILKNNYRTEDVQELDAKLVENYNKDDSLSGNYISTSLDNEIGIKAGRTIFFISELFPYNTYLRLILFSNETLRLDDYSKNEFYYILRKRKEYIYLNLVKEVMHNIVLLRKTNVCVTFLDAVANLLVQIARSEHFEGMTYSLFCEILKHMFYSRPNGKIMYKILYVLKDASKYSNFLNFLCQKPPDVNYTTDVKRELLYYKEDSCMFSAFAVLVNNTLMRTIEGSLLNDICLNVLSFMCNLFATNIYWLHYKENECLCLLELYQLVISVIYKVLLRYDNMMRTCCDKDIQIAIFKCSIKVLNLLTSNSYGLVEKNIKNYSRHREICNSLTLMKSDLNLSIDDVKDLELLTIDEVVHISSTSLAGI